MSNEVLQSIPLATAMNKVSIEVLQTDLPLAESISSLAECSFFRDLSTFFMSSCWGGEEGEEKKGRRSEKKK